MAHIKTVESALAAVTSRWEPDRWLGGRERQACGRFGQFAMALTEAELRGPLCKADLR